MTAPPTDASNAYFVDFRDVWLAYNEELLKANIKIDDKIVRVSGGGYVGVLSVYHELHCLVSHRFSLISGIGRNLLTHSLGGLEKIIFEVCQLATAPS